MIHEFVLLFFIFLRFYSNIIVIAQCSGRMMWIIEILDWTLGKENKKLCT